MKQKTKRVSTCLGCSYSTLTLLSDTKHACTSWSSALVRAVLFVSKEVDFHLQQKIDI